MAFFGYEFMNYIIEVQFPLYKLFLIPPKESCFITFLNTLYIIFSFEKDFLSTTFEIVTDKNILKLISVFEKSLEHSLLEFEDAVFEELLEFPHLSLIHI